MIRNPLKTAPKGLQESRGRKMLPERSEHGCFSKDSENQLSTYQKVCENNSSPLNYNYLNNKIIYREPGIAAEQASTTSGSPPWSLDAQSQILTPAVQCLIACSIVSHWGDGCLPATITFT